MLKTLSIKNFAIIEDIEISFKEGMNTLWARPARENRSSSTRSDC